MHEDRPVKTQIFVLSMGLTSCIGQKRFPKLTEAFCTKAMKLAKIGDHAKVVWMSDGGDDPASAVKATLRQMPNVVQHETVDHSGHQYSRSCMVKDFQLPGGQWTWRPNMAGDQKSEGLWNQILNFMPAQLKFQDRVPLELWIRYGQWRLLAGCEDVWPRFCSALGAYPERLESGDLAKEAGDIGLDVLNSLRDTNTVLDRKFYGELFLGHSHLQ